MARCPYPGCKDIQPCFEHPWTGYQPELGEISVQFTLNKVSPELVDLVMYGQSPGPHIVLGEN